MKINVIAAALAALCALSACEQRKVEEPVLLQEEPFTFTAVAGADTRVSAEFGDTENIINFKWSADDSLFVCFVEMDSLSTMTHDKAYALPRYVFKLKSGAGTPRASFQSVDMNPSEVLRPGVSYQMAVAYNPWVDNNDNVWVTYYNGQNAIAFGKQVHGNQIHHVDNPLKNVYEKDVLSAWASEITIDSTPEISFQQQICVYRLRLKNTGSDPISVASVEYPCSNVSVSMRDDGQGRYFGESRGILTCSSPVTIDSGDTYTVLIALMPCHCIPASHYEKYDHYSHIVNLTDGRSIRIEKNPGNRYFDIGRVVTTTLAIRTDMATDGGDIPPITGNDNDDF